MKRTLALLSTCLLVAACAGTGVKYEHDPDANLASYRSFAWLAPERADVQDPILDSDFLDRKVRDAVAITLIDRGYLSAPAREADFLVTYHTGKRERVESSGVSVGVGVHNRHSRHFGTSYGFMFGDDVRSRPEGMLIIDIVERETGTLVWRGWRSTRLDQERFDGAQVLEQVRLILADFPPGP